LLNSAGTLPSPCINPNRFLWLFSIILGAFTGSVFGLPLMGKEELVSGVFLDYQQKILVEVF